MNCIGRNLSHPSGPPKSEYDYKYESYEHRHSNCSGVGVSRCTSLTRESCATLGFLRGRESLIDEGLKIIDLLGIGCMWEVAGADISAVSNDAETDLRICFEFHIVAPFLQLLAGQLAPFISHNWICVAMTHENLGVFIQISLLSDHFFQLPLHEEITTQSENSAELLGTCQAGKQSRCTALGEAAENNAMRRYSFLHLVGDKRVEVSLRSEDTRLIFLLRKSCKRGLNTSVVSTGPSLAQAWKSNFGEVTLSYNVIPAWHTHPLILSQS